MTVDDLVVCTPDGEVVAGRRSPTTEKALHLRALVAHPEIGATMHCHALHASMFAITATPIPAVAEEFVLYVGGEVEVAPFRGTATEELAHELVQRVADRGAVLMANHGLFVVGRDPSDALKVATLVERTARLVWGARELGPITKLPDDVVEMFASFYRYGRFGS
jgi:L-fuculose-phosphate aldolase